MEGDSVTLHTDVKTNQQEKIRWYFNDARIAQITGDLSYICTDVQCEDADERFRERLKLDHQTGSLTIKDTRTTDSGDYTLKTIRNSGDSVKIFIVTVHGFFSINTEEESAFVMEGDSVTLHTDVKTNQQEKIRWYFNDARIAQITGDLSYICTDVQCEDADERFRERLKLDHQTGSLTIKDTRTTDSGDYTLKTIRNSGDSVKIFIVTVHGFFSINTEEESAFVMEGDSVTLHTDVKTNQQEKIRWYFNDARIAQITGDLSYICTDVQCEDADERFRERLKLDHQTGSLTIKDTRTTDSGDYTLKTIRNSGDSVKIFIVTVHGFFSINTEEESAFVMEGDSVTLHTDVKTNQQEKIRWYFNDARIAQITGDLSYICTDVQCEDADERFRERLKLDHQTGSLTIKDTRTTDSGDYTLKTIRNSGDSVKIFIVTVHGFFSINTEEESAFVMEGDSVTLHTDVKTNQQEKIRWYFNDARIAQITGDLSYICTDVQCEDADERFRERLKLDHQTGFLTIRDIRTTDSGLYRLRIISSNSISEKISILAVYDAPEQDKMKRKSVKEGESVTLDPGEVNLNYLMTWYFNDTLIAEITGDPNKTCTDGQCEDPDGRFRDRLDVNQTGSLTIRDIRTTDSGLYRLRIISSNSISEKISILAVYDAPEQDKMKRKSVKEGESVTLDPGEVNLNYLMTWYFNDTLIAEITGDPNKTCTDGQCEDPDGRFRDRLDVNQTGSLTVRNTTITDSGLYKLQINSSNRISIIKIFSVIVTGEYH
ncbi:muscle M-line assembly protein unc-89-like [Sinocyclocheilus rhinocerous]|uniref:muscle M-line assembly protein unc-89-like n=1 Tax=Sinocyclocheilus rhinocerous TaxID=307959 RepID=UPI0007B92A71|nr:PREDICTED: muscle M-line assembly protein unc-89-like [Sinocyclocheilus rhinocerous]